MTCKHSTPLIKEKILMEELLSQNSQEDNLTWCWEPSTRRTMVQFQFGQTFIIREQQTYPWRGHPGGWTWNGSDHLLSAHFFLSFSLTDKSCFSHPQRKVTRSQLVPANQGISGPITGLALCPPCIQQDYKDTVSSRASRKASFTLRRRNRGLPLATFSGGRHVMSSRHDARISGSHLQTTPRDQVDMPRTTKNLRPWQDHWAAQLTDLENHPVLVSEITCLSCFDFKVLPPIVENISSNWIGPVEKSESLDVH